MFIVITILYLVAMAYSIKRSDELGCGIIMLLSLIYFAIVLSGKMAL